MSTDPYFYERAEAELLMAQRATSPQAVKAHYELAGHYIDLFYTPDDGHPVTERGDGRDR